MDLSSNKKQVVNFEKNSKWLDNVSLTTGNAFVGDKLETLGYSSLIIYIDDIVGGDLSLLLKGNTIDSHLSNINVLDVLTNEVVKYITHKGFYKVNISGLNHIWLFTDQNTASNVTIYQGLSVGSVESEISLAKNIDDRKKIVQIMAQWKDCTANGVATFFDKLDITKYSYLMFRVRTRDATTNTYELRSFELKLSWEVDVANGVSTASVNGGFPVETVIDEVSEKDSRTDWIKVQGLRVMPVLYNRETTDKRYEVDILGIR